MSWFASLLYSPLQSLQRHTVRRDYLRETVFQSRFRALPPDQQWEWSFKQAAAFADRVARLSKRYREKLKNSDFTLPLNIDPEQWKSLPIIDKNDFRNDTENWYGKVDRPETLGWCWTSGSTGEPFKFPHTMEDHLAEVVGNELYLRAMGWKPHWAMATIKVEVPPLTGLRRVIRTLMGNMPIGFAAAEFRRDRVPQMVEIMRKANVKYLRGYSTSVYLFADDILQRGLSIHVPLITTFGEGLSESQAETIERAFGGKVYRNYGGSESMNVGYECRAQNGYHIDLSRHYVELVNDGKVAGPGESGSIVLTSFRNDAMPLVRYRIGDLGEWAKRDHTCSCDNRSPILSRVAGRVADTVITSTGHLVNVPLLVVVFEHAQEHISQFKVIQLKKELFEVRWVGRHKKAEQHIDALNKQLVDKTGGSLQFRWTQVDSIPPEPSGKCRILVPLDS